MVVDSYGMEEGEGGLAQAYDEGGSGREDAHEGEVSGLADASGFDSFDDTPVKTIGHKLTFEELIEKQLKLEEEKDASAVSTQSDKPKFKFLRKGDRGREAASKPAGKKSSRRAGTKPGNGEPKAKTRGGGGAEKPRPTISNDDDTTIKSHVLSPQSGEKPPPPGEAERDDDMHFESQKQQTSGHGQDQGVSASTSLSPLHQSKYLEHFYDKEEDDEDEIAGGASSGSSSFDRDDYEAVLRLVGGEGRRKKASKNGAVEHRVKTFEDVFGKQAARVDREVLGGASNGAEDDDESVSYDNYDSLDDDDVDPMGFSRARAGEGAAGAPGSGMRGHLSAERRAKWERKEVEEAIELREFDQLERQIQEELLETGGETTDRNLARFPLAEPASPRPDLGGDTAGPFSGALGVGGEGVGRAVDEGKMESGMPSMLQQAGYNGKSFSETMRGISLETHFDDTTRWMDDDDEGEDDSGSDGRQQTMRDPLVAGSGAPVAGAGGSYAEQYARGLTQGSLEDSRGAMATGTDQRERPQPRKSKRGAPKAKAKQGSGPSGSGTAMGGPRALGEAEERPMSALEEKHVKLLDLEIKKVVEERRKLKRLQSEARQRASALEEAEREFDRRRKAEIENIRVMKDKAERKIKRDRRVLDQQSRTLLSKIPSKKDREEIQQIEALLDKERQAAKRKERNHKMNEDRLRRQVAELTRRTDELKEEVRRLERRHLEALESRERSHASHGGQARGGASAGARPLSESAENQMGRDLRKEEAGPAAAHLGQGGRLRGEKENHGGSHGRHGPAKEKETATATAAFGRRKSPPSDPPKGVNVVTYPNGTRKQIQPNGDVVIQFNNGDHKISKKDTRTVFYYYCEVDTWHTTYSPNIDHLNASEQGLRGVEVFHFPSGQIEAHFPDGAKEVLFPDGIAHRLDPEGEEHQIIDAGDLCEVFSRPKPQVTF